MDKILISMPSSPREFFLAMPVVQDYIYQYVQEAAHGARHPDWGFTFRMSDVYKEFEAPLKVSKNNVPNFDYTGWTAKCRSEFDCFIDFDFAKAEKISLCTGKHITESLGILLGCTPRKWPILAPPRCTEGKGILIVPWSTFQEADALSRKISNSYVFVNALSVPLGDLELDTVQAVVGGTSLVTHVLASYNRPVIEIFPDEKSYLLYNNEGIANYQAIIGDNISAGVILETWENLQRPADANDWSVYAQ